MVAQVNTQEDRIPDPLLDDIGRLALMWAEQGRMQRCWSGDETLWTSSGESAWLGWLTIIGEQVADSARLREFAARVQGRYTHAVLLGMGGSSLCPEVLRLCCGKRDGFPDLRVVDSTDPVQVKACEDSIQIESSLFLSASKSGSTLRDFTAHRVLSGSTDQSCWAPAARAEQFVAITIRDRSWIEARQLAASGPSCTACLQSAAGTPRSRTSGWCRQLRWAWMWTPC